MWKPAGGFIVLCEVREAIYTRQLAACSLIVSNCSEHHLDALFGFTAARLRPLR